MKLRLQTAIVALCVHALMPPALAAAPPETPTVIGVVRDSAGMPLPNAQVLVSPLNRVTTTNGEGVFTVRGLPGGPYHLTAIYIGFAPGHADVVVPASGDTVIRVTISLRASPLTHLSSVMVSATPIGSDPRSTAQPTTELSGRALTRSMGTSVAQTLSQEPGIAVRFNGPVAAAPVIRGLQGERILVLQDGERSGDLSSAAADHANTVDPLTAERIEVVRGPASLLYGNNALGGVVNVISNDLITTIPSHVEGYLAGQAQSVSPGGAIAAGATAPLNASLAVIGRVGGRRTEAYRQGGGATLPNTFGRNLYGVGGMGYSAGPASGAVVVRAYDFEYGLPSAELENARIKGHRQQVAARTEITANTMGLTSVRVSGTSQWYHHDEVASSGVVNTSFNLQTQTLDGLARTQFGSVAGAVGLSGLFKQYASTGDEALTPGANSSGLGAFLFQDIPLNADQDHDALVPHLQVGARADHLTIASTMSPDPKFGAGRSLDFTTVSGSVGVSLPLGTATVGLSAARAFRAPSVEELFSNAFHAAAGSYDRGNPDLTAEINQGLDLVVRVQRATIQGQVGAYYSRIHHFISPNVVKDTALVIDGTTQTVPLNQFIQADAALQGLEGRVEATVAPSLVVGAMGDLTRGSFVGSGEPLPYLPPARLGVLARWDNRVWSFGGDVRYAFTQTRVPAPESANDPAAVATDAFTLVDLTAGYQFVAGDQLTTVMLRVDNLLDTEYRDATSRIKTFARNPGRNVSLVYKLNF